MNRFLHGSIKRNGWDKLNYIDLSIDKREFAKQYNLNKKRWDVAFDYLKNTDLSSLNPGNYPIDGDNVYVKVTEVVTKNIDSTSGNLIIIIPTSIIYILERKC